VLRTLALFGLFVLVVSATGCGGPKLVDLEGTVTYDGQVVDAGAIDLISLGEGGRHGGGSIVDGKIILNTENRPPAGKYRVEFHWSKKTGKQFKTDAGELLDDRKEALPDKYHKTSQITIDLVPGSNVKNFALER
jgi:hypothetical protein